MLNRMKEGFERYPSETTEAVWLVLVKTGIVGGVVVVLAGALAFTCYLWVAR